MQQFCSVVRSDVLTAASLNSSVFFDIQWITQRYSTEDTTLHKELRLGWIFHVLAEM